jgi:hypothetical protein
MLCIVGPHGLPGRAQGKLGNVREHISYHMLVGRHTLNSVGLVPYTAMTVKMQGIT